MPSVGDNVIPAPINVDDVLDPLNVQRFVTDTTDSSCGLSGISGSQETVFFNAFHNSEDNHQNAKENLFNTTSESTSWVSRLLTKHYV